MYPGVSEGLTLVAEQLFLLLVHDKGEFSGIFLAEEELQMGWVGKENCCLSFKVRFYGKFLEK